MQKYPQNNLINKLSNNECILCQAVNIKALSFRVLFTVNIVPNLPPVYLLTPLLIHERFNKYQMKETLLRDKEESHENTVNRKVDHNEYSQLRPRYG